MMHHNHFWEAEAMALAEAIRSDLDNLEDSVYNAIVNHPVYKCYPDEVLSDMYAKLVTGLDITADVGRIQTQILEAHQSARGRYYV